MSDVLDMSLGRNRVRAALISADGLTSQQVGENSALEKLLGLPGGVVAAAPDRARQEMTYRRITEDELFARWAEKSKENAALARDDTDGLLGAFRAVENFGNRLMHWAVFESAGDVKDMGREIGNVSANIGRQLVHGAADFNRSLAGAAQSVSENIFGPDSAPSRYLKGVQEWVKWARPDEVRADSFLGQLGYDFVRSVPQQAGNIVAALSNPAAALSLMGVQITGGSYANLRDEGVSPGRALVSSLTNAAAQAPLEKLGLDRFMSIFRSSSFRDTIGRTLGSMGTEMVTEYLQKWPDAVTELWALAEKESDDVTRQIQWFGSRLSDVETLARINREGAYEGLIGAMWGGLGGGVRSLAVRDIARQKAADFARQNVELHAAVEATQTKQVAPDHMADALASASDVLAQSVYIPAQAALDMAAQGRDILTPLGISAEQARQALESGADLEVSLATLHARLDSAGMESVAQIMRQTADAPNALEAEQVDSAAQAQAVVEDARRRLRRNDAVRKEEARLVSEMLPLAGNRDAAEQYAKLFRAQATAFETAYGVDAVESLRRVRVERGEETARGTEDESGALGQPVNDGVDLDASVRIVSIAPRFEGQNPKVLRKRFPEDIRQSVLNEFSVKGVVNADTGKRIGMSKADFHEHMKFSDTDAIEGLAQLEAVAALPDLMRNAKLVESYDDKKNNPNIKKMHRFQAALRIGRKDYSVKLTVKEFRDGTLMFSEDDPFKLYHHRLEKEMPAGNSETLRSPGVNRPSASISEYSLRALLEDVKDSEGQRQGNRMKVRRQG